MALAQLVASIRSAVNEGTVPWGQRVTDWFTAHPDIIVQGVIWNRPDSTFFADDQVLRVSYLQASGASLGCQWVAKLYQTSASATAQEQFTAEFTPPEVPPFTPLFVLDVTNHERARTGPDCLLVIGIDTASSPLGMVGYDRAVFVANPNADIPIGGTGDCTLLDASGRVVSLATPVTNVGAAIWAQDQRNYAVYDESSGQLIGLPTCAAASAWAVPAATTTTAYPCPAYLAEVAPEGA
jgi:hypothetical protein